MSTPSPRAGRFSWLRRLNPLASKRGAVKPADPLRSAGQMLRETREAKGLGLRDLAQRTRISIAVLEAMERGWKDRLPEATYLRAMLPLLEDQLDLPEGSLEPLLLHARGKAGGAGRWTGKQVAPFSPATLQLLASWQSALVYGLLVLGLIYGVNLQQNRLAAMGRVGGQPIHLGPNDTREPPKPSEPFPDLHPLKRAAQGQAMNLLTAESRRGGPDQSLGLLKLSLRQPTQVDLRSARGGTTVLEGMEGDLSLPVLPPFELRLSPAPAPSAVRWKGRELPEKARDKEKDASDPGQTNTGKPPTAVYAVPWIPGPKSSMAPRTTP